MSTDVEHCWCGAPAEWTVPPFGRPVCDGHQREHGMAVWPTDEDLIEEHLRAEGEDIDAEERAEREGEWRERGW